MKATLDRLSNSLNHVFFNLAKWMNDNICTLRWIIPSNNSCLNE